MIDFATPARTKTPADWKSRAVSAAEAVAHVRSGTNVFIHGACATPTPSVSISFTGTCHAGLRNSIPA